MSTKYLTKNPYEEEFGYSRATRRGPYIFVSGTTSTDPNDPIKPKILFPDSAYDQTIQIFKEIIRAVEALGGTKGDVTRVRMFVTKEEDGTDVAKALKETFGDVRPAATMVFGVTFVNPDMRVEIEADAIVI